LHSINKANFAILYWFGMNLAPRFTDMQAQLKHARVPRLDGRISRAEFLPVNTAVENLQVKRVAGENRQLGDEIADLIVRRFQRGQTQVLLLDGFQDVIRNIAGLGHAEIAVVHRLGDDHRVERCQRRTLPALRDHHFVPKVFRVLFDGRQFGQRVLMRKSFCRVNPWSAMF
jgi:hypothetical protein